MMPGLLLMDMDSTLINEEGIDLLADRAGIGEEVAALTSAAMKGDRDFYQSLVERVALLEGQQESLLVEVREALTFTPGALDMIESLRREGWLIGVVSGGFHEIIDRFLQPLELDLIRANRFEIHEGRLTGKVLPPIVGPREKVETLRDFASQNGIPMERCIAIGDGANDRDMVTTAGIGIAFCAKPALRAVARYSIQERDLSLVLDLVAR